MPSRVGNKGCGQSDILKVGERPKDVQGNCVYV